MCPVCVSVLLSHTVLLELYEETLVTEDDVKRMKGVGGFLGDRVVLVQCTKPPDVVTRTCKMLDQHGYNASARQLRGWWGSQTTQQWTQCNSWASPPYTRLDNCLWPYLTHVVSGGGFLIGHTICLLLLYMCTCVCVCVRFVCMNICVCVCVRVHVSMCVRQACGRVW